MKVHIRMFDTMNAVIYSSPATQLAFVIHRKFYKKEHFLRSTVSVIMEAKDETRSAIFS